MILISAVIGFTGSFLLTMLVNWLGLIPWRRAVTAHWTERARLLTPVRFTAAFNVFFIPLIIYLAGALGFPQTMYTFVAGVIAGFFGSLLGRYPMDHEIHPGLGFRGWCHQIVAGWGILFGFWIALGTACFVMPARIGWGMLLVAIGYLFVMGLFQWGLVFRYLRWVRFMKPAGVRLRQIVGALTGRMNVKVGRAWQLEGTTANALALPLTRELIFSNRLLEICSDEEVSAICAHEMAHLTESKTVLAARMIGSLCLFPLIFISPCVQYFGPAGLFIPLAAMFLLAQFVRRLSRKMEKRADQMALAQQTDEGVYARTLEKLYRANQTPAIARNNRQTHPHLYDRMLAAGITPEYPRPKKPRRFTLAGWIVFAALVMLSVLANFLFKN